MRIRFLLGAFITILIVWNPLFGQSGINIVSAQSPSPTPDRLAEPELPADPSQYEQGRHLFWTHCMPCHGDLGQGLTEEFIQLWPEDHQNCWARGCHRGQMEDEGFPIPRTIPAVISSSVVLPLYADSEALFGYLHTTHPPQNPGYLLEDEYWAITAYVMTENNLLPPGQVIGPHAGMSAQGKVIAGAAVGSGLLVVGLIFIWTLKRRKAAITPDSEI